MEWLKQFKENYEGKSPEAKALEPFLKENYKGNSYIPWATMERLVYAQDPNANFDVVKYNNDLYGGLGVVHTNKFTLETFNRNGDKEVTTKADFFAHFVIVRCTFLGKTIEEIYPIQDNVYDAPKVIDANLVNNSIQRAKVKVAARVTGLGLKLYEGFGLQFGNDDKPKTNTVKDKTQTSTPKVEKTTIEGVGTTTNVVEQTTTNKVDEPVNNINEKPTVEINKEVWKLAEFLHKNEDILVGIQRVNTSVATKYGFVFDINEDVEVIYDKLSKVANPATFIRSIKVQSGLPIE
jgi:hypothetical protein